MSRRLHEAPFAVTMDGSVLISAYHFDRDADPQKLLRTALALEGDLFIAVAMTDAEVQKTLMHLDIAGLEVAAAVVAERRRRSP
jgi:hypothetical protein